MPGSGKTAVVHHVIHRLRRYTLFLTRQPQACFKEGIALYDSLLRVPPLLSLYVCVCSECPELGFVFVEINGLRLSSPCQAYSLLWHAIVHHNAHGTNAAHVRHTHTYIH